MSSDRLIALTRGAAALGERLLRPWPFFVFVSAVMVSFCLIRAYLFSGMGGDDSEQLVFAQQLAVGYFARNPPLYTWLVIGAQSLFGTSVLSVLFVKFASLWGTCVLLFLAGRAIGLDERRSVLTGLSPLGLYFVLWDSVTGLTDSALVMALCVATFLVLVQLERSPRLGWYVALGVLAGLGMITKYGYGIFLVSLLAAAMMDAELRSRIVRWRTLLSLAALICVVAPFGLWFASRAGETVATDMSVGYAAALQHLAKSAVSFLTPLWVLILVFFWRGLRHTPPASAQTARYRRLAGRQMVLAILLFAVVVAISGLRSREYYMFVLILFPLYVFARFELDDVPRWAPGGFAGLIATISGGAVLVLAAQALFEPLWCEDCERHLPYNAWAAGLREAGFERGTIVADWYPYALAGSLKTQFPDSRVISVKHAHFVPANPGNAGQCLVVWSAPSRRDTVIGIANGAVADDLTPASPGGSVSATMRLTDREESLLYVLEPGGAGRCR